MQFGNYSELGSPAFTAHNDDARAGRAEQRVGQQRLAKGMNSSVTALLSFSCFWCWLVANEKLSSGGGGAGGGAVDFLTKIYRK